MQGRKMSCIKFMKNAVVGFILLIILVFTGITVYSIEGKTVRKNELDTNLGAAMEQSMTIMTIDPTYTIRRDDGGKELIADFIENFLMKTTSDSIFDIEVISVDAEKGLLDVRATERFPQITDLNGKPSGNVSVRKTVILEDYVNEENLFYKVSFYVEQRDEKGNVIKDDKGNIIKDTVKQVNVHGGDTLLNVQPKVNPILKGYRFVGWRWDKTGTEYTDISSLNCMEDMEFTAVFEKDSVSQK